MGVGDFNKPTNELSACKNIQEDAVGILKRVPGTSKVGTNQVIGNNGNVNFLGNYYQNSTSAGRLIAGANDNLNYSLMYRINGDWQLITGATYTDRADAELSSANYLDKMFIIGYDSVDSIFLDPATIKGTTFTTLSGSDSDLLNMPGGKFIVEYNDLLYVLNAYVGTIQYTSSAYFSNDPVTGAITWNNAVNFLEFGQQDGDEITGAANSNDRLVVFKTNSMWTWDENSIKKLAVIGCDSYKSIQNVNGLLYWFNRDGLWRWDGGVPQLISGKVQPFIDAIPAANLNKVVSTRNGLEYRTFIGTVTVKSITYTNCWIVFDVRREKFFIRCIQNNVLSSVEYTENSTKRTYYGSNSGYVYKFSKYSDNVNTDDNADIDYFFVTNTLDLGTPHMIKHATILHVYTLNSNNLKYICDKDKDGQFKEGVPGQINGNVYTTELDASGYRFTLKFYNKDHGTPMEFEGFTLEAYDKEDL